MPPGDHDPAAPPTPVRSAATVALLRSPAGGLEVHLARRPRSMAFGGDLQVFPGGAVDPEDADPALAARADLSPEAAAVRLAGGLEPAMAMAHHVAAIRELFEEAGVFLGSRGRAAASAADLAGDLGTARRALLDGRTGLLEIADRLDLRLAASALSPLGHWVTPPGLARRFDTWFFAAELPPGATPSLVGDEVAGHVWLRPLDALDRLALGELSMLPPTAITLEQLAWARGIADLAALAPRPGSGPELEWLDERIARIRLSGAGGLPGRTASAWLVGRRELVLVDPGDPDKALERCLGDAVDAISPPGGRLVAIALTSGDPDHAAGVERLSRRLDLPIHGGPGSGRWLASRVIELADGARLPAGDIALHVVATPGPRPDHVAYRIDPEAARVGRGSAGQPTAGPDLIVGDLAGAPPDAGPRHPPDLDSWRRSIDRLAQLRPARLLPGHGPAIGPDGLRRAAGRLPGSGGS